MTTDDDLTVVERSAAAEAITRPACTRAVSLTGTQFHNPTLGAIWDACAALHAEGHKPNPVSIRDRAATFGARVDVALITSLIGDQTVGAIEDWAATIIDQHRRRGYLDRTLRIRQMIDQGAATDQVQAFAAAAFGAEAADELADGLLSLDEFADQDIPDTEWVIPGLLARGDRVVITGGEGTGKTTLCRELAVCTAAGFNPFTRQAFPRQKVLVVDAENPKMIMRDRFRELRSAMNYHQRPVGDHLWIQRRPQGLDLSRPADRMWLHQLCQMVNPDLLVIGPAYKLYIGGSNSREEDLARQVTSTIDELRERYNFAVLLEHHTPHPHAGQKRSVRPIGSTLWMRWPEFGIGLALDDDSTFRMRRVDVIHWRGQRDERPWPKVLESGGSSGIPWIDPDPPRHGYGQAS